MDGQNRHPAAYNGPPAMPDVAKSNLSANAAVFIPRTYQPPPPPENEVRREMQIQYQGYVPQTQQPPQQYEDYNQGGHRGAYGGGNYYNNRGNFRGNRGRGRGRGGGRGGYRGNFHNNYHGGPQIGGGNEFGGYPGMNPAGPPGGNFANPNQPQDSLQQLKQAIEVLNDSSEMFNEILTPLTGSLATNIGSESELRTIVDELINRSVRETNFRYIGAKMCNFLSQHLQVQGIPNGIFKAQFLTRLQEEQNKRDQVLESPQSSEHLIGFTLFMGELLVNPTSDPDFPRLIDIWTVAIAELVETLLAAGHDNCLRAVVQVLKLTGSQLDQSDSSRSPSGRPERMDVIFDKIKAVIDEDRMQHPSARSVKVYLQSVVDLRGTDWGKREADGRPKQINPYLNMPVPVPVPLAEPDASAIYEGNGMVGYQQQMWSNGSVGSDFTPALAEDPAANVQFWSPAEEEEYYAFMMSEEDRTSQQEGGMDEEIADAFEEFMRENDARQANV